MWYFISAIFGAVVGIFLLAIVSVNRKDEERAYSFNKGYKSGYIDGQSVKSMRGEGVFFICDRKACGDHCPNEMCKYTQMVEHAANFEQWYSGMYWEKDKDAKPITLGMIDMVAEELEVGTDDEAR